MSSCSVVTCQAVDQRSEVRTLLKTKKYLFRFKSKLDQLQCQLKGSDQLQKLEDSLTMKKRSLQEMKDSKRLKKKD